jgi:hypothetical protein
VIHFGPDVTAKERYTIYGVITGEKETKKEKTTLYIWGGDNSLLYKEL